MRRVPAREVVDTPVALGLAKHAARHSGRVCVKPCGERGDITGMRGLEVSNRGRAAQQQMPAHGWRGDRSAAREGGAEGRRWRWIGMERWRQAMHALAATKGHQEEHGTGADGAAAATASARESARGGWTMAAALIAYKTREAAARRRREAQRQRHTVHADARGAADVVVFDVETTTLIDSATPVIAHTWTS